MGALSWLKQRGYPSKNVILFGESLGTGVACVLAAKVPPAAVVLQSPFDSLVDLSKEKLSWLRMYPAFMFPGPAYVNSANLASCNVPIFIAHGQQDAVIPITHADQLARRLAGRCEYLRLAHSGHNDIYQMDGDLYCAAVCKFLQRHALASAQSP